MNNTDKTNEDIPDRMYFIMHNTNSRDTKEHMIGTLTTISEGDGAWISASIYRRFDPKTEKPIYSARYFDGTNIIPPSENLKELKRDVKAHVREINRLHSVYKSLIAYEREDELREIREWKMKRKKEKGIER